MFSAKCRDLLDHFGFRPAVGNLRNILRDYPAKSGSVSYNGDTTMKFQFLRMSKARRASGTFMVLTTMVATMVILPLAMVGFELSRVHLMQRQLRASTDSAALGAATAYGGDERSDKLERSRNSALNIFKRNTTCGGNLAITHLVSSIGGTHPAPKECLLEVTHDKSKSEFVAKASFGYTPAFASFLGLGMLPIVSFSKASAAAHKRDIVVVFDTSGSMAAAGNGQPMMSAKAALADFLRKLHDSGDVHFGVVTYATHVAGNKKASAQMRRVELDRDAERYLQSLDAVNAVVADGWTNTDGGLKEALKMLKGQAHRDDADPLIVLVSDGLPNQYYRPGNSGDEELVYDEGGARDKCYETAMQAGKQGITVHSLGFFHVPSSQLQGIAFMKNLKQAAGGDSESYTATNISEFHKCLDEICNSALGLVN